MSVFNDAKRAGYRSQRSCSQGASITLVSTVGGFNASFECAKTVATVLGERELQDLGDGIYESIPAYFIPLETLNVSLQKLTLKHSVALVDLACGENASQFTLIWKIEQREIPKTPSTSLDEF